MIITYNAYAVISSILCNIDCFILQDNSTSVNEVGDRCQQAQRNYRQSHFRTSVITSKTPQVESYLPGKQRTIDILI